MKKILAVSAIIALSLGMSACGESVQEADLRLGIECKQAGGSWIQAKNDKSSILITFCEFRSTGSAPVK